MFFEWSDFKWSDFAKFSFVENLAWENSSTDDFPITVIAYYPEVVSCMCAQDFLISAAPKVFFSKFSTNFFSKYFISHSSTVFILSFIWLSV